MGFVYSQSLCTVGLLFGCQENVPCKVTIKSHHGKYVSAEPTGEVNANQIKKEYWTVTFIKSDVVSFKSRFNKYLVAESNGHVNANRNVAGAWEEFTVVDKGNGFFNFRSHHGKYLDANRYNENLNADHDYARTWETFKVEKLGENTLIHSKSIQRKLLY